MRIKDRNNRSCITESPLVPTISVVVNFTSLCHSIFKFDDRTHKLLIQTQQSRDFGFSYFL